MSKKIVKQTQSKDYKLVKVDDRTWIEVTVDTNEDVARHMYLQRIEDSRKKVIQQNRKND